MSSCQLTVGGHRSHHLVINGSTRRWPRRGWSRTSQFVCRRGWCSRRRWWWRRREWTRVMTVLVITKDRMDCEFRSPSTVQRWGMIWDCVVKTVSSWLEETSWSSRFSSDLITWSSFAVFFRGWRIDRFSGKDSLRILDLDDCIANARETVFSQSKWRIEHRSLQHEFYSSSRRDDLRLLRFPSKAYGAENEDDKLDASSRFGCPSILPFQVTLKGWSSIPRIYEIWVFLGSFKTLEDILSNERRVAAPQIHCTYQP